MINPTKGVKIRLSINAHPNPMLRLLPNSPTNTESRHPENNPNNIISVVIMNYSFIVLQSICRMMVLSLSHCRIAQVGNFRLVSG